MFNLTEDVSMLLKEYIDPVSQFTLTFVNTECQKFGEPMSSFNDWETDIIESVVKSGNINMVEWICSFNEEPLFSTLTDISINNDDLPMLVWLVDHGCYLDEDAIDLIHSRNHKNVVEWLKMQ